MAEGTGALPRPIPIEDVIRQEREFLGLSTTLNPDVYTPLPPTAANAAAADQPGSGSTNEPAAPARSDQPWALCLSGGGIRSATFGLGILQGLAEVGALRRFHYLSTVSGGGYIGSWLSRWIHEEKGNVDRVQEALDGNASRRWPPGEPAELRSLRAYSNYLSPVWGLSTDFFALVSIFLRNLLLNWLVLLPLLFALVLVPRLYVGAMVGITPTSACEWTLIAVASVLIATGLAYVVADLPSEGRPDPLPGDRFSLLCFLPIAVAAAVLGILIGWNGPLLRQGEEFHYVIAGVVVHIVGCVAGMIWRARRKMPDRVESRSSILATAIDFLLIALTGAAGGWLIYALATWRPDDPALHATVAAPILLFAFWLATTLYVALVKYWSSEGDREWWARSGAWWLRFALSWLLGFGLVIYVPQWIGDALDGKTQYAAAAGGLWGVVVAAIGYWTKNGAKITDRAQTFAGTIGMRLLDVAAIIFIVVLLIAFCFAVDLAVARGVQSAAQDAPWGDAYGMRMQATAVAWPIMLFVVFLALSALFACFVGINTFSLHGMYGNRLVRAYFGAARKPGTREPHWFTGFDFGDNVSMAELQNAWTSESAAKEKTASEARTHRLLHVVNVALNLVSTSGGRLEWQQRKAASFTVSKLHSGSDVVGFLPSALYSGISLGRAMTISGAAASSNMGYHSSKPVAIVMTLFNVRLGWWLPNPGYTGRMAAFANAASEPRWALRPLMWEALSATNEKRPYLYLSDGGHFDNLGLYEMVRRGCRRILVVDATSDPQNGYKDLQDVMRKIRVDFGIPVDFVPGALDKARRCVIGRIGYRRGAAGVLYYVKPMLCGDEPLDVRHYAQQTRTSSPKYPFPHQSTGDQFFDEAQFESYRLLGWHTITKLWSLGEAHHGWPSEETLKRYQQAVADYVPPEQPERAAWRFGRGK